jgi:hypothetical protein
VKYDAEAFRELAEHLMDGSEPGDEFRRVKHGSCLLAAVEEAEWGRVRVRRLELNEIIRHFRDLSGLNFDLVSPGADKQSQDEYYQKLGQFVALHREDIVEGLRLLRESTKSPGRLPPSCRVAGSDCSGS